MFSQSTFIDLCERELRLCALAPGESLVVLSQGDERSEYVDAFMAAGQRLGASVMNLRLPYSSSASDGDVGVWTVGNTPLKGNRPAVEVLKARRHGGRDAVPPLLRGADGDPAARGLASSPASSPSISWHGCSRRTTCAGAPTSRPSC